MYSVTDQNTNLVVATSDSFSDAWNYVRHCCQGVSVKITGPEGQWLFDETGKLVK